ncbi:hydroxymethylglutaryl-CoA lyase [Crenobacter intestini]|uniref:hydroxymethylglutaryl-CoA lyase n=1 Tax=Crenobacter intestini TaxID=2563443 RepID=A0A4T0V6K8_9NEIS|nr:hydroxymethylglutaryl-CoA lyase [Crenobacter intestini]TIC86865.1 hydroxymethylglutaryl-CoA lyase [Crenobacter intestini]
MARVKIVEVGPRDGLQNERQAIPLAVKLALIGRLADAGLTHIEAGAFVSPKCVPQMADTAEVLASLKLDGAVRYPVLVPNLAGLEAALKAGAREIAIFGAASETFSRKNINVGVHDSLARFEAVAQRALAAGLSVRGYVSCVVGCPYEGDVSPRKVAEVAAALYRMGCYEVSLGDTVGVGTPDRVLAMLDAVTAEVPVDRLAGHFHDTYGMAIANIYAALCAGVRTFDSSVAGLGGCPYARGASGNVATEDVLYLLHGMGYTTGVNLDAVTDAAWQIADALGREPGSKYARARGRSPAGGNA